VNSKQLLRVHIKEVLRVLITHITCLKRSQRCVLYSDEALSFLWQHPWQGCDTILKRLCMYKFPGNLGYGIH